MSHFLSFIKTKGKVGAYLAFAALLTSSQLFAQTVNTATVTRPAGLVLTCVNGPAGTGLSYASGAPASCSATDSDLPNPRLTVTKTAIPAVLVVGQTGQFYRITIAVANGPTTAAITIADTLPAGISTSGAITATGGTISGCPASGATSLAGCSIAAGAATGNIVVTVPVTVAASAANPSNNTATVTGGGDPSCPAGANCTSTVTTPVIDAVNDTDTKQPNVPSTTTVTGNDKFPVDSTVTVTGGTCTGASPASPATNTTGILSYTSPIGNSSCTVIYQLCAPSPNASICDTATLTVTSSAPVITIITPQTVAEGTATQNVIQLSAPSASPVTVTLATAGSGANPTVAADLGAQTYSVDGGATFAPVPASGIITIPAGVTAVQVRTATVDDTTAEPAETFSLTLSAPTGATLGTATVQNIISANDAPVVSIANAPTVAEGTPSVFAVTLSNPSSVDTVVTISTANGTAIAPGDYTAQTAVTVTIPAGQTTANFSVPTIADALPGEPVENFTATISAVTGNGATIGTATGTGQISDSTAAPVITIITPQTVAEGTATQNVIQLSAPSASPVTVTLATAGSGANPTVAADLGAQTYSVDGGANFLPVPASGIITIPAGVTAVQVRTATVVDAVAEPAETFSITISSPVGAVLGAGAQSIQNTISAQIELTVVKTVSQSPLAVGKSGQFYTITINVANGPTTAIMTVADVMPTGITLSAAPTAVGGVMTSCPVSGSSLAGCTIAANTNGPVVITVPVIVGAAAAGNPAVNSATVSGGGDLTCPAAAHCTGTVTSTVANPDMQVNPNTSLPPAVKDIPYPPNQTVTCTNISTVDAANAFCTVTDLPQGLISTCSPASPVALLPAGEKIICTISGTPTVTVAIKAKVVTGADGDSVSTNNDGELISTVSSLSVAKTVSANPLIIGAVNQFYSISVTVTNGPTIEPITLNDNFATGITTSGPVTISGGNFKPGTCAAASSAGATSLTGCQIEPGVTGTVYINVPILVDDSAEGPSGGNNTVTASGGGDPLCPVSSSCIGSTGTVAVIYGDLGALFIRKVADRSTGEVGDVITYKVTVRSTKIKGAAIVKDHLPFGFKLIANTTRVSRNGTLVAAPDPAGAPGPDLTFTVQIPAIDQDVEIEYKVRVGLGSDRGDGTNTAQASMLRGRLQSLIAKAKVKISGGVFTREACIVGKVYADCNGNAVQDNGEIGISGVALYLEDGTSMTTDVNGLYSICGVRAITHVLKVDSKTLPKGAKLGITGNRNAGDPNSLFVDVLAGQLHNTEFRIDSCSPQLQQSIDTRQKNVPSASGTTGGIQFDSTQPKITGSSLSPSVAKTVEAGSKQ